MELTSNILWLALIVWVLVDIGIGWPIRRMRGHPAEIAVLLGVWLFSIAALIASLGAGNKAEWDEGVWTLLSILTGMAVGLLWNIRVFEWAMTALAERFGR